MLKSSMIFIIAIIFFLSLIIYNIVHWCNVIEGLDNKKSEDNKEDKDNDDYINDDKENSPLERTTEIIKNSLLTDTDKEGSYSNDINDEYIEPSCNDPKGLQVTNNINIKNLFKEMSKFNDFKKNIQLQMSDMDNNIKSIKEKQEREQNAISTKMRAQLDAQKKKLASVVPNKSLLKSDKTERAKAKNIVKNL